MNGWADQNSRNSPTSTREVTAKDMSLRDYFAAQALKVPAAGNDTLADVAREAYRYADAMLKAREP